MPQLGYEKQEQSKALVAVKRQELRFQRKREETELLKAIITNPVVEIIAAFVIIEALQKNGTMPQMAGNIAEGGVLAAVAWQQMSPSMPYIAPALTEALKGLSGVTSLIPLAAGL